MMIGVHLAYGTSGRGRNSVPRPIIDMSMGVISHTPFLNVGRGVVF